MTPRKQGAESSAWKGGRTIRQDGYVLLMIPEHPRADSRGYVYEHIVVAEKKVGRSILPGEEVHHRDENPSNNHPDNLEVKGSHRHHFAEHRTPESAYDQGPDEDNVTISCACGCGQTLLKFDRWRRSRRFVHGHSWIRR